MLVLTRRQSESIVIQGDITITVLEIAGERVKLGVNAPAHVLILRQELCEAVKAENLAAARSAAAAPQPDQLRAWLAQAT